MRTIDQVIREAAIGESDAAKNAIVTLEELRTFRRQMAQTEPETTEPVGDFEMRLRKLEHDTKKLTNDFVAHYHDTGPMQR